MISEKTLEQDLIKEVGTKSAADVFLALIELIILRTDCGCTDGKRSSRGPLWAGSGVGGRLSVAAVSATACFNDIILEWKKLANIVHIECVLWIYIAHIILKNL